MVAQRVLVIQDLSKILFEMQLSKMILLRARCSAVTEILMGELVLILKGIYLASPPLVVAFAIVGTVEIDLTNEPIATVDGRDIFLRDIWPTDAEVQTVIDSCLCRDEFVEQYANVFEGGKEWKSIESSDSQLFDWSDESTYIHEPPFLRA